MSLAREIRNIMAPSSRCASGRKRSRMAATLSASPSLASHCATTRSPPRSTASLMVFPSTAYRPMMVLLRCLVRCLGQPPLDKPAHGADPSTAGEPCRKRFDPGRSVKATPRAFLQKWFATFSRPCSRRAQQEGGAIASPTSPKKALVESGYPEDTRRGRRRGRGAGGPLQRAAARDHRPWVEAPDRPADGDQCGARPLGAERCVLL